MNTQIRNYPGMPSYFGGAYRGYGQYQWNIKFYGFNDEFEIESAQRWAFGEYSFKTGSFEGIDELLGRMVKASTQGRSGGWLVIDSELTETELKRIDSFVSACMAGLESFLVEERDFHASEAKAAADLEASTRTDLETDLRIVEALDLIKDVAGLDATVVIKGIKLL